MASLKRFISGYKVIKLRVVINMEAVFFTSVG